MNHPSVGFAAASERSARVLILGSLPGVLSLKLRQYYAKPQNAFWRIMGTLVGAGPDMPYSERIRTLTNAGIALWDVCASAHRLGSLDSAIKHHAVNDFASFFDEHPHLRLICFNGHKAADLYRRSVLDNLRPGKQSLSTQILPSTSPANAGVPYDEKLRQWSSILEDSS